MVQRIFLESKPVSIAGGTAGHMYLVLRDVEVDTEGAVILNEERPNDLVLRGSSILTGTLGTYAGLLAQSEDHYEVGETPESRHSVDITSLILGSGDFSSVASAWNALMSDVLQIDGAYNYELPGGVHTANSNAVIFSVLAGLGIDLRDLTVDGQPYVDSFFYFGMPGGNSNSATLIATDQNSSISAEGLAHDTTLLGRDGTSDIFVNSSLNERFFGEQRLNGDGVEDTVNYFQSSTGHGIVLTATGVAGPSQSGSGIAYNLHLVGSSSGEDDFFGIERVSLTDAKDVLTVASNISTITDSIVIDAGAQLGDQRDVLDFSGQSNAVALKHQGDDLADGSSHRQQLRLMR